MPVELVSPFGLKPRMSFDAEVIKVQLLHFVGSNGGYPNIVLHHQGGEFFSIDENDFLLNSVHIVPRIFRESRCSDEHALLCPVSFKASSESLDLRPTHRILPTFRLYVDSVQPQLVLLYNAVNPSVA